MGAAVSATLTVAPVVFSLAKASFSYAWEGNADKARKELYDAFESCDRIPGIGHLKAGYHAYMGETDLAWKSFHAANKSTLVLAVGAATGGLGTVAKLAKYSQFTSATAAGFYSAVAGQAYSLCTKDSKIRQICNTIGGDQGSAWEKTGSIALQTVGLGCEIFGDYCGGKSGHSVAKRLLGPVKAHEPNNCSELNDACDKDTGKAIKDKKGVDTGKFENKQKNTYSVPNTDTEKTKQMKKLMENNVGTNVHATEAYRHTERCDSIQDALRNGTITKKDCLKQFDDIQKICSLENVDIPLNQLQFEHLKVTAEGQLRIVGSAIKDGVPMGVENAVSKLKQLADPLLTKPEMPGVLKMLSLNSTGDMISNLGRKIIPMSDNGNLPPQRYAGQTQTRVAPAATLSEAAGNSPPQAPGTPAQTAGEGPAPADQTAANTPQAAQDSHAGDQLHQSPHRRASDANSANEETDLFADMQNYTPNTTQQQRTQTLVSQPPASPSQIFQTVKSTIQEMVNPKPKKAENSA